MGSILLLGVGSPTSLLCGDADANAFLTAASITDPVQINAICYLVTQLKIAGLWTKVDALYPVIGGSAATHKFNLKNPLDSDAAFRLIFSGTWVHSATGMKPNGTNAFANTWLQANTLSANNHLAYYSRDTITTGTVCEIGAYNNAAPASFLQLRARVNYASGGSTSVVNFTASGNSQGFWLGTKRSNSDRETYKNGVSQTTSATLNAIVEPSQNIYIGARNDGGTAALFSTKQCAFASIGGGLTDTDVSNYYTIVQNYQTLLGRQV